MFWLSLTVTSLGSTSWLWEERLTFSAQQSLSESLIGLSSPKWRKWKQLEESEAFWTTSQNIALTNNVHPSFLKGWDLVQVSHQALCPGVSKSSLTVVFTHPKPAIEATWTSGGTCFIAATASSEPLVLGSFPTHCPWANDAETMETIRKSHWSQLRIPFPLTKGSGPTTTCQVSTHL